MADSRVSPERIWIVEYTVTEDSSSVLCRGLTFRSIHNSQEEAEKYFLSDSGPYATGCSITEYVLVERADGL